MAIFYVLIIILCIIGGITEDMRVLGLMVVVGLVGAFVGAHKEDKEKAERERQFKECQHKLWEEERANRKEKERREQMWKREREQAAKSTPTHQSYTHSCSFANDSSYSSVASGFNCSTVRSNDDLLNKMGNPYLSNYEKHLIVKEDIQRMVDSHLPMNSIYRNSDGSVKQHDYSAFGIAANTPDIDLAEAQMFSNYDTF